MTGGMVQTLELLSRKHKLSIPNTNTHTHTHKDKRTFQAADVISVKTGHWSNQVVRGSPKSQGRASSHRGREEE
jgi:hypothetical protein